MDKNDLEDIFDITIDDTIDNVILVNNKDGDKLIPERGDLRVNIAEANKQEREQLKRLIGEQFDEEGRVLRLQEETETKVIYEAFDDEQFNEILEFFDGILEQKYVTILNRSLKLRAVIEAQDLSKEEIYQRKSSIADDTTPEAYYISSLCTAGYFDEDRELRDIYLQMGINEEYDRYNFNKVFSGLIENKLLCVFIESDMNVTEAKRKIKRRISKHQAVDPLIHYLDVRGIGRGCEAIIDQVIEEIESEATLFDYDRWYEGDEIIVRIRPKSSDI